MTIWFTSDLHFGHRSIITLGKGRPFSSIEEHDNALISNWNRVVKPNDLVYVLGDFSLRGYRDYLEDILGQLNGAKHLILGNHDKIKEHAEFKNKGLWQSIRDYHTIKYNSKNGEHFKFILSHFPILEFDGAYRSYAIHLYGHIHNMINYDKIYQDLGYKAVHIGVDTSSEFPNTLPFSPISIEDIITRVKTLYGDTNDKI